MKLVVCINLSQFFMRQKKIHNNKMLLMTKLDLNFGINFTANDNTHNETLSVPNLKYKRMHIQITHLADSTTQAYTP